MSNTEIEIIDFIDLVNYTLSQDFLEKWRHKYSPKFIRLFQMKIMEIMAGKKPANVNTIYTYLTKKCKYSGRQVRAFFDSIEIDIYSPLIYGDLNAPG